MTCEVACKTGVPNQIAKMLKHVPLGIKAKMRGSHLVEPLNLPLCIEQHHAIGGCLKRCQKILQSFWLSRVICSLARIKRLARSEISPHKPVLIATSEASPTRSQRNKRTPRDRSIKNQPKPTQHNTDHDTQPVHWS